MGDLVFRHACKLGVRGHRVKTAQRALPVRGIARLAQGEEPGQSCDAAGAGGDVVAAPRPIHMRPAFNFRGLSHEIRAVKLCGIRARRGARQKAYVDLDFRDRRA
jgi:hypothetical protein